MANIIKIDFSLNGKNLARLENKKYDSEYTVVPNRVLPLELRDNISMVYLALTGETFDEGVETFTVRADKDGDFKNLYTPQIMSQNGDTLVVKWGKNYFELVSNEDNDGFNFPDPLDLLKKSKITFSDEEFGRYKDTVAKVTLTTNDGITFSFALPVAQADYENPSDADTLNLLMEDSDSELFTVIRDKETIGSGGKSLVGHVLKAGVLPLGDYTSTAFITYESDKYGTQYMIQMVGTETFEATTAEKIDGEWIEKDVVINEGELFIVKANSSLKKLLSANPVVSEEFPATFIAFKEGTYNNNRTVRFRGEFGKMIDDDGSLDLNF